MATNTNTAPGPAVGPLHVLVVSNHWGARRQFACTAVFVDRQVASLRNAGTQISTFDLGTSHSPLHLFRKWRELRREARRLNPDLVHARYGTIVATLSVLSGYPTVITFCGSDLLPGASISIVRTYIGILLSNLAAVRARGIICVSEQLRQALWWSRGRAVVIPDGVDLDLFAPGSRDEARKELGWDLKRAVVIIDGRRDAKNKGLDLAEVAIRVAQSRIPEAKLHVTSNVEPTQMPLYYRAADALLVASKQEGSPNVVKEALACNLPVVSVPVGDVPERLADVNPSAVIPRDPQAVGEALVKILLARERSNGRKHVSHLALENVAHSVMRFYHSVLDSRVNWRDF